MERPRWKGHRVLHDPDHRRQCAAQRHPRPNASHPSNDYDLWLATVAEKGITHWPRRENARFYAASADTCAILSPIQSRKRPEAGVSREIREQFSGSQTV